MPLRLCAAKGSSSSSSQSYKNSVANESPHPLPTVLLLPLTTFCNAVCRCHDVLTPGRYLQVEVKQAWFRGVGVAEYRYEEFGREEGRGAGA
jgi:hypothetical protein